MQTAMQNTVPPNRKLIRAATAAATPAVPPPNPHFLSSFSVRHLRIVIAAQLIAAIIRSKLSLNRHLIYQTVAVCGDKNGRERVHQQQQKLVCAQLRQWAQCARLYEGNLALMAFIAPVEHNSHSSQLTQLEAQLILSCY